MGAGGSRYLHVEGDPILAVQNGAVHIKRSQFPQFSLIVARHVENGTAWYVLQRGARSVVGTEIALTPGHSCQESPTDPPKKKLRLYTQIRMCTCVFIVVKG